MRKIIDPFAKHTPSVFVLCSPFQILCAIAAIKQLEIVTYKLFLLLKRNNVRNEQAISLLETFNIPYKRLPYLTRFNFWSSVIKAYSQRRNEYKRLFVGDFRNVSQLYAGLRFVSDNSNVVILDDGNATISILNGVLTEPVPKIHVSLLNMITKRRKVVYDQNFLTIYSDIANKNFKINKLYLDKVSCNDNFEKSLKNVYIVGTKVNGFCNALDIPVNTFIQKLGELMHYLRVRFPDETIYYIPHGRDNNDFGEKLCQQYGCVYSRPDMMIEMELLNLPNPPKAIYGYTSTALYTLKKLFPASKVVNILFDLSEENPAYKRKKSITEYYLRNGIECKIESIK